MGFEFYIARRYLTSKRRQAFISVVSLMSVLGVAIGVGALVVVMGVYNGFSTDIRNKLLGANSHILVQSTTPQFLDSITEDEGYKKLTKDFTQIKGVKAVAPYIYTEVLLSTPRGATGLIVRGIDPKDAAETLPMLQDLVSGTLEGLEVEKGAQGIIVGSALADRFGLLVGTRVHLMSPAGEQTTAGFVPKLKTYKVIGIFKAGLNDYDSRLAFISLNSARDLVGMPEGRVTGIELFLDEPFAAKEIAQKIEASHDFVFARNWVDLNTGLFAALQLEKVGMFLVLSMIILIGSFSIITSLVMLVMEKKKDIAILMSMGAKATSIRKIFMLQGTIIGVIGTLLGYFFGLSIAFLLKKYKFIELPEGVYTTNYLPIIISVYDVLFIGVASFLICFLATIYPARQAAKLAPTEALRYE